MAVDDLETARHSVIGHIASKLNADAVAVNNLLIDLEARGLIKISCRRGLGPRCGCPAETVRRVECGGTCGMGGCPYGGDM